MRLRATQDLPMRRFPRLLLLVLLVLSALLLAGCGGPRALDRTDATAVAQAWLAAVAAQDDRTAQALYFSPNDPLAAMRGQGTVDLYRHFIGPDSPALQYGAVTAPPSLQWVDVMNRRG